MTNDSRTTRARLPLGVLGMLGLVFAIETAVEGRHDMTSPIAADWKHSGWVVRRKEVADSAILCLGTSLTRMGVSPVIMQEVLREPVYNLSIPAAGPSAIYSLLRQALESGAKPKAIMVDFPWIAISRDFAFNERVSPEVVPLRDCIDFGWTVGDGSFLGRLVVARIFPSYRRRLEVRANIGAALRGEKPDRVVEQWIQWVNLIKNRGANLINQYYDGHGLPDHPSVYPANWTCPAYSEAYIEKFLDLADSRGIRVFWLIPPLPPATQAALIEKGIQARYERFVESFRAKHPNMTVLDASGSSYPFEVFWDPTHLNRDGAVPLSRDLAYAIWQQLGRPTPTPSAWVKLNKFVPEPAVSRVEDIQTTFARLQPVLESLKR
jgi:hypothetical protein